MEERNVSKNSSSLQRVAADTVTVPAEGVRVCPWNHESSFSNRSLVPLLKIQHFGVFGLLLNKTGPEEDQHELW